MRTGIFLAMLLAVSLLAGTASATIIDFEADAFRPGTNGTYAIITEHADGDGIDVKTSESGQKALYGTTFFNGWTLSMIDSVTFTFRNSTQTAPYMNVVITDGNGAYGVISSQGGYRSAVESTEDSYKATMTYYFAGMNGNSANNYNFKFYEPVSALWGHGANVNWGQISTWQILGIGATRPLSPAGSPGETSELYRAPLTQGLSIMWGDSASNYLGYRDVFDVFVTDVNGNVYNAGVVPEPATMTLLGLGLGGLALSRVRRRKAA